ncbi:hypothetical protein [Sphingosinicella terrae]|uniref:hypothetical protein n=1 Tax=Sphingosinicella terrae TaxID=2172047 RepID=UPI0013B46A50|nr:hypothetical protein [Sphingosinicella terrae]
MLPGLSTLLTTPLTAPAPAPAPTPHPSRPRGQRHDGWTPERIAAFLRTLAQCGCVADAARAAGMSPQGAYAFRARAEGRAFDLAWRAAMRLARPRVADELVSRVLHGTSEIILRDGKVWGERHRFDNRLAMFVLSRLDRQAEEEDDGPDSPVRIVAEEFDQFVGLVCEGGAGAADFLRSRGPLGARVSRELRALGRVEHYRRHGVGLPDEIGAPDPDPLPYSAEAGGPEAAAEHDRHDPVLDGGGEAWDGAGEGGPP